MPRSISKLVMMAVAIGVAVVGASAIGIAAAQSSHEQAKTAAHRIMATVLKTEFRSVTISNSERFSWVGIG